MKHELKKSTWAKFLESASVGLVYFGSYFNKSLDDCVNIIDSFIEPDHWYIDRVYVGGKTSLRFNILDENGHVVNDSYLDRRGTVYKYKGYFIIHSSTDYGDRIVTNAVIYKDLNGAGE